MNGIDSIVAMVDSQREAVSQFWTSVGAFAAVAVLLAVFCIGVFPSLSRAYRRIRGAMRGKPVQTAILVALSIPLIHYGSTKYVKPLREVSTETTPTHVRFEWAADGIDVGPTTQFVVSRLEVDGSTTNKVQYAIVDGATVYDEDVENADAYDWVVEYLPPHVVTGDDIVVTMFRRTVPTGLRIEWETSSRIAPGDVFHVECRHRAIPSRDGWTQWYTVATTTDRFYADVLPHHHRDEEWRVTCTKQDE